MRYSVQIVLGLLVAGEIAYIAISEQRTRRELEALRATVGRVDPPASVASGFVGATWSAADAFRMYANAFSHERAAAAAKDVAEKPPEVPPAQRALPTMGQVQENVLAAYAKEPSDPAWTPSNEKRTVREKRKK